MEFGKRIKDFLARGVTASKDLVAKGALKIKSAELKSRAEALYTELGTETYDRLVYQDKATISRESPIIVGLLEEIKAIRLRMALGKKEYLAVGAKRARAAEPKPV